MNRAIQYLEVFKENIILRESYLKIPKFYYIIHIVDYITIYGYPMSYDGSMSENFDKLKITYNAKLTKKEKETLKCDIG